MSRILTSSVLIAAALVVAGCGSSNSTNPGNASLLNGQYAFEEQVYTFYAGGTPPCEAAVSAAGKKLHFTGKFDTVPNLRHGGQATGQTAKRLSASSSVKPEQGDCSSAVDWGAEVGSLTFDGNGNVTAGEVDFNEPSAITSGFAGSIGYYTESVTGSYIVNSDNTVEVALNGSTGDNYSYQLALEGASTGSVATGAQLIEGVSDAQGDVEIGTGQMVAQSAGATLNGNYVFGIQGQTCFVCSQTVTGDIYAAGMVSASGGTIAGGSLADISTGFSTDNLVGLSGSYASPDANGRLLASLATSGYASGSLPAGYVVYTVNGTYAFILSTDQSSTEIAPFVYGFLALQTGSFGNSTVSGNYVAAETTEDLQNENPQFPDTYSDTYLALLSSSGGTLDGTGDENLAGAISSNVPFNYGSYTVAANGRMTLTGTTPSDAPAPVFWLQNSSFGFGVDQLGGVATQEPGLLYLFQQTGTTLSGTYALGNLPASTSNVGQNSQSSAAVGPGLINGVVTANGGTLTGGSNTVVQYLGGGFTGGLTANYTIGSNGRGTITTSSSSVFPNGSEVIYVVSPSRALSMDVTAGDTAPSLEIFQQ